MKTTSQRVISNLSRMNALVLAAIVLTPLVSAKAADIHWQDGTASYNTPADWDSGTVPGIGDSAINASGTNNAVQINAGDPDWSLNQILADNGAFEQNGQNVNLSGTNLNGSASASLRLGVSPNGTGIYTLNDGAVNYGSSDFNVGELGAGILNINGGTISGSGNFADNLGASPVPTAVTATVGNGLSEGDYTWFEQGVYATDTSLGLPMPGTTIISMSQSDHSYNMPPSYTNNDSVLVSADVLNAAITLTTPAAYSGLSFLATAGDGPVVVNYTVHHQDGTTETGSLSIPDWFGPGSAQEVLAVGCRVNAFATDFQIPGPANGFTGNAPYLWSLDVVLTNTSSAVTSIDLAYVSGGTATVLAVSSQAASGGEFSPVAMTGYNEDVIVAVGEASPRVSGSITDIVNQNGGAINVTNGGQMFVGNIGNGIYNLTNGTIDVHNYIAFGRSGGNGTFNMVGGALHQDGGGDLLVGTGYQEPVGADSSGVLNQSGGIITSLGSFLCPEQQLANAICTGTYNLSGTGILVVSNWIAIGRSGGVGTLNISGGSITKMGGSDSRLDIGAGGPGTINQDGGAITNIVSETWIGENSLATWNLNGGIADLGVVYIGYASGANGTLNLNGGTLIASELTTSNVNAGSGIFFNGGTIVASGDNANFMHDLTYVEIDGGGATFDSQDHNITIEQEMDDGGGGLTKNGSGTLTLTGANTYTGPTVVNAGALLVGTSASGGGDYTIADNSDFGVIVQSAGGQLNVNNLSMSGSTESDLNFELGNYGNPGNAPLNVSGSLAASGNIVINITDSTPQLGQFPLIKYGTLSGSPTFTLGSLPSGMTATLVDNTANNSIDLNITAADLPRWDGSDGGDWDIGLTTNWINIGTGLPIVYTDDSPVVFDDNASGTTTVNLVADVNPGSLTVTNNNLNYTFVGTGKISGSIGLTKQGSGTLNILNTGGNNYTGPTVISGGTLAVTNLANGGQSSPIGASSADPANLLISGTLEFNGAAATANRGFTVNGASAAIDTEGNLTLGGKVVTTAGNAFSKTGPGQLTLTAAANNEFSSGPNPGLQVVNGTLLLDGSAGNQTNHISSDMYVGNTPNSGASLILSNTTVNVDGWFAAGRINGGVNNTSTVTLYDSTFNVGHLSFGWDGGQPGNLSSQFLTMNGNSVLNDNAEVNLCEGSGSTLTAYFNDNSIFNTKIGNDIRIALATGSTAIMNFNGNSVFNINNPAYIAQGTSSTGMVVFANSSRLIQSNGWFDIAQGNNSVGTFIVKDNASVSLDSDFNVTDTGTGATATALIEDNATLTANNLWVGKQNGVTAMLTITNNAVVNSHNGLTMATYFDGSARVPAAAILNLAGGSLAVNLVQGSVTSGTNNGTFNFNGGTLIAQRPVGDNFMFNLAAINILAGGAVIDSQTNTISIAQPLLAGDAGNGGLTKIGSGTLRLNGVNTYTGDTLVNEGALGGTGTIAGDVTVASGAALKPGSGSVGTLTINSNLTLEAGSTTFIKLGASSNDEVSGLAGANYGGVLVVTNTTGSDLTPGQVYTLFNSATAGVGNFASVTILPAGAGTFDPSTGQLTITSGGNGPALNPPTVSSGNLILTGTGGTPGGGYTLLSTTNLVTPLSEWMTNTTGILDETGSFSNAIPLNATNANMFFRVRMP